MPAENVLLSFSTLSFPTPPVCDDVVIISTRALAGLLGLTIPSLEKTNLHENEKNDCGL
jgi:hypothetical protein